MDQQITVIKDNQSLKQLRAYLADKDYVTFDTETTGLTHDHEIIGYSVCAEKDVGYYVVLAYWDVVAQEIKYYETKDTAKDFMDMLRSKKLVMHNAVFDCDMVRHCFGVDLMPSVHTDTMILAHLLDENRPIGLKDLAVSFYGQDAKKEQTEMKESIAKNGGELTRKNYELYKADQDLIAAYGAKDAILTWNVFCDLVSDLAEQGLMDFFYNDESMPLLRGPTYDLNTTGLRVDVQRLDKVRRELEIEIAELKNYIFKEIHQYVREEYPGTCDKDAFNLDSNQQMAWLLFHKMGLLPDGMSEEGKQVVEALGMRTPYTKQHKLELIAELTNRKGRPWRRGRLNPDTGKLNGEKLVKDYWVYFSVDRSVLQSYAGKYRWIEKLLEYKRLTKLLTTYVEGIQSRVRYGIIRPGFKQAGTTSGRYSSVNPNFQNLPRDDKRIKSCIVAREGNVFVGADYSQLEPRVFASVSQDENLLHCFRTGLDFYSVIGASVFDKTVGSLKKSDPGSFAELYPDLRQISKTIALSATYGTTAFKMSKALDMPPDETQEILDNYFGRFPAVRKMMLDSHEQAKTQGYVVNTYGRPRRLPKALEITKLYGTTPWEQLHYKIRSTLNLAVNHRIQSTAASIMNRAAIAIWENIKRMAEFDTRWNTVKIVLQVHDELVLEGPEQLADDMAKLLKHGMENAVELPGVDLIAEPKVGKTLAELK